ncbi:hypothetical protein HPP92_008851 [Vanilla planifolia]|uniref:peptide-methionine (S)-S-oxide reductase n=1 Tax=Vanilla planifolia TaxID=51239 RepID=A0A835REI8_VANPL|nr:hypothetical protein HPP92_008851 [Vanilla planifolia]
MPSSPEVLEGKTGHTEAVKVTYDNRRITYKSLCKLFFESHDPTNKEYLGFGLNTHRRSAIFYATEEEGKRARESKVEKQMKVNRRVVTVILKASTQSFYLAECHYQKHYLQLPHLLRVSEGLALRCSLQFAGSHLACKLNGIFGGEKRKAAEKLVSFMNINQIPEQAKKALQEVLLDLQLSS